MLAKNILILSLVHLVRLLLPLLLIPLLANRISGGEFGVYMYALSFAAWLAIFVEYGFNISSTREIASSAVLEKIRAVIIGTQSAKWLLVVATTPLLLIAIYLIPVFDGKKYWAVTGWVLGVFSALAPIYYFQGKENLKLVGVVETVSGFSTVLAVYFTVKSSADFYLLPLILVVARGTSSAVMSWWMLRQVGLRPAQGFDLQMGKKTLYGAFHLFVFQGAVGFYTSFNVVFLGFFCSPAQVGIYAAAERLMRAGLGFIGQFSNAIFPRLNALKSSSNANMEKLRSRLLIIFLLIGIAGMGAALLLAPPVVHYLFSADHAEIERVIKVLSLVVPAIALSNVLGFQYLLVDRHERVFNMIIGAAAVANIGFGYFLIQAYGVRGMAISWVVVEWLITLALLAVVMYLKSRARSRVH